MPKNTFFNLSEEKRERIVNSAMDEFANYSFSNASVNRIIKESGIAVGSFYQYFDDLKDLYIHVLKIAAHKKYEYLKLEIEGVDRDDFFQIIRALYRGGIRFALTDKRLFDLSNNILKEKDVSIISEIYNSDVAKETTQFVEELIARAIKRGELRDDISPSLITNIIFSINISIIEDILSRKPDGLNQEDYNDLADIAIDIMLHGIGKKSFSGGSK